MKTLVTIISVLITTACTTWPEPGRGGLAERSALSISDGGDTSARVVTMAQEFSLQSIALDVLILKGARSCIPARVEIAEQYRDRTHRAIVAGLEEDAENDLIVLHKRIDDIQRRLVYLSRHTQCASVMPAALPTPDSKVEQRDLLRENIALLLNSHTQFDSGMALLLPQYERALQLAAAALKDQPVDTIAIRGHADNTGNESSNEVLGQRRAEAVRDALVRHGVAPNRLVVESSGARAPIAPNSTSTGRLANRRVELTVRFAPTPATVAAETPVMVKNWSEKSERYDLERGEATK